jgi:hypothetical protein
MKYIVQRQTINGWEVAFHDIDENNKQTPVIFGYPGEAEKEIQSYLAEVMQAVADGNMDDCETRDDLQIVPLDCPSCGAFVEECYPGGVGVLCRKCAVHAVLISEPSHEPRS